MSRKFWLIFLIISISILLLSIFFWEKGEQNKDELVLYGNVDVRQVDIGFRVAGQVKELLYEEGDVVKKGDLVATLDKSPYDRQLAQSKASQAASKVNLENAEILYQRRLANVRTGGVSQEELDNARYSRDQLRAILQQNEAAKDVAQYNLSYTEVYAPTDGIILTRIKEPGSTVSANQAVYTISISNPVWIRAFVAEPFLGKVTYGMPAEIYTDTLHGKVYQGKVGFISPVSEFTPKTVETTQLRTDLVYRLRIYVDQPDSGLRQGQPVTVKLKLKQPQEKR